MTSETFDEWLKNPEATAPYKGKIVLWLGGRGVLGAVDTWEQMDSPVFSLHRGRAYVCDMTGEVNVVYSPKHSGPRSPSEWMDLLQACQDGITTCMVVYWAIDQELADERIRSSKKLKSVGGFEPWWESMALPAVEGGTVEGVTAKSLAKLAYEAGRKEMLTDNLTLIRDLRHQRDNLQRVVGEIAALVQRDQNEGTVADAVKEVVGRRDELVKKVNELNEECEAWAKNDMVKRGEIIRLLAALHECVVNGRTDNIDLVLADLANKYRTYLT